MIYLYVLPQCGFCNAAIETLNKHNIPFKKKKVTSDKKENYKKKHKHETFPQIILKVKNEKFLLGGSEIIPDIIKFYKKKL